MNEGLEGQLFQILGPQAVVHALIELLTNAGLRTKPTKRNPAGIPVSINKLGLMLRDRYYLGIVAHQGIEYPGRHEALVTQEIFDRVQATLDRSYR